MITQYFDINARQIIQAPGTLAAAGPQTWVYGDNYNLAIYLTAAGIFQPIRTNDSLGLMLFQPGGTLPETNLAIIGTASILTDPIGNQYYQINVNLQTTGLADLVQVPNQPAKCQFHYVFTPGDGERFSSSADIQVTVNPDPTESAAGATPVPPGYPPNPNVFQLVANKGQPSGYAPLDINGHVPVANLPAGMTGGDMLKSVYDTANRGYVDRAVLADTAPWAGITGKPATFQPPIATLSILGGVMPDGATIAINSSGVISAVAGGIGQHGARCHCGANLAANANMPNLTALTFDTSEFDTDNYHTGANWSRLTVPAGQAGLYAISGNLAWPTFTATNWLAVILKNGATILAYAGSPVTAAVALAPIVQVSTLVQLAVGDYIQLVEQFSSGSGTPTFQGATGPNISLVLVRIS